MLDNKPKFRSRKLENNRGLPVYQYDDPIDLDEYNTGMRAVQLVATGVDKEEEEEHHLQVALNTSQVMPKEQAYVIPTPEAAQHVADYARFYPVLSHKPHKKPLIRHSGTVEDLLYGKPRYVADAADCELVGVKLNDVGERVTLFEHVMECFENAANRVSEAVVGVDTAVEHLQGDDRTGELLQRASVGELGRWLAHWQGKRRAAQCRLVPALKHEDLGKIGQDPYVCFRRRELKQPRKTRRSDAQIMEKIRKIRYDFATLRHVLQGGMKRDRWKLEALRAENEAFERYWTLKTWQQHFGIERPPTVPSFKSFHQQVPPIAGAQNKQGAGTGPGREARRPGQGPKKTPAAAAAKPDAEDGDTLAEYATCSVPGQLRIAIPPMSIRSVKHSRPYYPFEIVKQIQKDIEGLYLAAASDEAGLRDGTVDLGPGRALVRDPARTLVFRRARNGRFYLKSRDGDGDVDGDGDGYRGSTNYRQVAMHERLFCATALGHLRSVHSRDCAHLNNAFIGNYNQHYLQNTAALTQPTSLGAWIQATAGLALAADKKKAGGGGVSPSKKRKALLGGAEGQDGEEGLGGVDGAEGGLLKKSKSVLEHAVTDAKAVISSLTSSPQFTVKVKSSRGAGADSSDAEQPAAPSAHVAKSISRPVSPSSVKTKSNAARFTPTGLSSFK